MKKIQRIVVSGDGKQTVLRTQQKAESQQNATTQSKQKIRVAAYCRVSTLMEEQELSYESQSEYYKAFIESRPDMELVEVYGDHGASGLRMEERPEFQRMVEDGLSGKIDVIYTKSVSRFARNARECEQVLEQLRAKGVCVIFEEQNIKSTDPQFSLVLKLLESIAQEQSNSQSQSILWSVDNNAALGRPAYKCCFGYVKENVEDKTLTERERHTWSINEEEAEMIRTMFDMIEDGYSTYAVAKKMTEMEEKRGGDFELKSSKIPWMLRNIAYKGDILTHKTVVKDYISGKAVKNKGYREQYYLKGHHPAIICEEQFENVQKIRASRSKKWKEKRS